MKTPGPKYQLRSAGINVERSNLATIAEPKSLPASVMPVPPKSKLLSAGSPARFPTEASVVFVFLRTNLDLNQSGQVSHPGVSNPRIAEVQHFKPVSSFRCSSPASVMRVSAHSQHLQTLEPSEMGQSFVADRCPTQPQFLERGQPPKLCQA